MSVHRSRAESQVQWYMIVCHYSAGAPCLLHLCGQLSQVAWLSRKYVLEATNQLLFACIKVAFVWGFLFLLGLVW